MSPKIPTELAYARTAANIAWDRYDAALGTPFQAELWKVVNWMEERASRIYRDWQAVGGTSDIDSITAVEIANDNNWLGSVFETLTKDNEKKQAKSFIELAKAHHERLEANKKVWVKPDNCQHEKARAIHSGMRCDECRETFAPRNEFEQSLVNEKNPRSSGYVNWKMR